MLERDQSPTAGIEPVSRNRALTTARMESIPSRTTYSAPKSAQTRAGTQPFSYRGQ